MLKKMLKCSSASLAHGGLTQKSRLRILLTICQKSVIALLLLAFALGAAIAQTSFGSQKLGESTVLPVQVTMQSTGTVSTVRVLTYGAPDQDYRDAGGSCANQNFSAGQKCSESVSFAPQFPGSRQGAVVLLDSDGHVLGTSLLTGTGSGGLAVLSPGNEVNFAGSAGWTQVLDGNPAVDAQLNDPSSVVLDGAGNLYIADSQHNRIRMVSSGNGVTIQNSVTYPQAGYITTVAGNGSSGWSGDNGLATGSTVALNKPSGIALDGAGNLYIADTGNNVVRKLEAATGIITTIAGNGNAGSSGDNGPALRASLNGPWGVTVDLSGNLYIADTGNHKIRAVCANGGTPLFGVTCSAQGNIITIAGTGFTTPSGAGGYSGDGKPATQAELNYPYTVAIDASGAMYIPDSGNNRVRRLDPTGSISTFAGTGTAGSYGDGAAAAKAQLQVPTDVVIDAAQNVLICDSGNSAIRKVNAQTKNISTLIRGGVGDYLTGQTIATTTLYGPTGIALDGYGNLYIADTRNSHVRQIQSNVAFLDFTGVPTAQGTTSSAKNQILENDGTDQLTLSSLSPDANSAIEPSGTTCLPSSAISVGGQCTIATEFSPSALGNPLFGNIAIHGQGVNELLTLTIAGDAIAPNSTATTTNLVANSSTAVAGTPVVLIATVTSSSNAPITGSVSFTDGATKLGSAIVGTDGIASLSASFSPGAHNITASYSGDSIYKGSTSTAFVLTVTPATTQVALNSSSPTITVLSPVSFGATVSGNGGVPTGSVVFSVDGKSAGSSVLDATGRATLSDSALSVGTHSVTASYSGDKNNAAGTSPALNEVVAPIPSATVLNTASNSGTGALPLLTADVIATSEPMPTGTVTFMNGSTAIGSASLDAGGTASLSPKLTSGSYKIVATYGGDLYHASSSSSPTAVTIGEPSFNVNVTPGNPTVATGNTSTLTIALASPGAFSDTVQMGCLGLPALVTCHFSSDVVKVKSGQTSSVQVIIDTNSPLSGTQTTSKVEHGKGTMAMASVFWPASLVLGCLLWSFRKKSRAWLMVILALCLTVTVGLTGCATGFTGNRAAPGTYQIQVGGTGLNSNTSEFQTVTLTVTK